MAFVSLPLYDWMFGVKLYLHKTESTAHALHDHFEHDHKLEDKSFTSFAPMLDAWEAIKQAKSQAATNRVETHTVYL